MSVRRWGGRTGRGGPCGRAPGTGDAVSRAGCRLPFQPGARALVGALGVAVAGVVDAASAQVPGAGAGAAHARPTAWAASVFVQRVQPGVAVGVGAAIVLVLVVALALLLWRRLSAAEREARTREQLLGQVREGILEFDSRGRCTFANQAAAQMLGAVPGELQGRALGSLLPLPHAEPGSPVRSGEPARPLPAGTSERIANAVLERSDGTTFVADCRLSPIVRDQKVQGALLTFSDVSELVDLSDALRAARADVSETRLQVDIRSEEIEGLRRELADARERAEAAQRQAEQQYRDRERADGVLADLLPQLSWSASPDGLVIAPGRRWREFTGVDEEAVEARLAWQDVVFPDDRNHSLQRWQHCAGSGEPCEVEHRLRRHDGEHRWFLTQARPVRDGDGRITRWLGVSTDIQSAKDAAAALRDASAQIELERKRLASLLLQAPVAIAVLRGPEHCFEVANAPYMELVGERNLTGRPAREILSGTASQGLLSALDRVYQTGETFSAHEVTVPVEAGLRREDRWYDFIYQPLFEVGGDVSGIFVLVIDVSDRVRGRREVDALQEEVRSANRSRSDFLGAMGHELRTPLNAIAGYVDLVILGIHGPVTEAQSRALERVKRSQRHLLALIDDILSYARLESGRVRFRSEPVALGEVVAAAETLLTPQAQEKGLGLEVVPCEEETAALADAEKVQQIVVNLMTNAVKYTEAGGRIRVQCAQAGAKALVRVSDTGLGIPEEKIASIFDPFVQVERGMDRPVEGVGLGLAISRDLARGMGGDLTVESVVGEGSTFTLTLPRAPTPERAVEEDASSTPVAEAR